MNRVRLFGMEIDAVRMSQAVDTVFDWVEQRDRCRFVVTPNTDHSVLLQHHQGLQAAYTDADLVLADGMPLIWASRLLRKALPERVAGSDLVPQLFSATNECRSLRVFLLGAAPGVADRAANTIRCRWPHVEVVGTYSPPLGFEKNDQENERILQKIARHEPDVLVVGFGAPKQELWVHRHRDRLKASAALCAGATIDFLAGHRVRAPRWMQKTGLEWFYRVCREPRRLAHRYAKDAWVFPQLVAKEWLRPS